MFINNTSLIIPTKNRENFLKKTFKNLGNFKNKFKEILIIDSSDSKIKKKIEILAKKNNAKYFHTKASSSFQRNYGLKKKNKSIFTMFLDDDLILKKKSFIEMNLAIKQNLRYYDAFAFNLVSSQKKTFLEKFKKLIFFKKFSLYSDDPGEVSDSGWHTRILNLKKNTSVMWIYIGATIFKSNKIKNINFDNNLGEYSYLEDLDFSLQLTKRKKKILVVSKAVFRDPHYINRDGIKFGIQEIKNRFLIVKKHNLKIKNFFIVSFLRFLLSFFSSLKGNLTLFLRSVGNLIGILFCLIKILKFKS